MVKNYDELENFNDVIISSYTDLEENSLKLPPDVSLNNYDSTEMKKKWDDYFYFLLKIPKIEQNESFRDFFNLNRLGVTFEFTRGDSEIFDFT